MLYLVLTLDPGPIYFQRCTMLNKFAIILTLAMLINPNALFARGILIPEDKRIAPLILVKQIVGSELR